MHGPEAIARDESDLLAEQKTYYDAYADPYTSFIRRYTAPVFDELEDLITRNMQGVEHALELAAGPGTFTRALSAAVGQVTVYDAAPNMLAILNGLGLPNVETVEQDVFAWEPEETPIYGAALMGNFLAHVPKKLIPVLFAKLARVLKDDGHVSVIDVTPDERFIERAIGERAGVPTVRRKAGGQSFDVIKVYWDPDELLAFLALYGWTGTYHRLGDHIDRGFVYYRLEFAR